MLRLLVCALAMVCARGFLREQEQTADTPVAVHIHNDDDAWTDLDTGARPANFACTGNDVKVFYTGNLDTIGRDSCHETCLDPDLYAFYQAQNDELLMSTQFAPCAALGYTLFYKTTVSAHISIVLSTDVYIAP